MKSICNFQWCVLHFGFMKLFCWTEVFAKTNLMQICALSSSSLSASTSSVSWDSLKATTALVFPRSSIFSHFYFSCHLPCILASFCFPEALFPPVQSSQTFLQLLSSGGWAAKYMDLRCQSLRAVILHFITTPFLHFFINFFQILPKSIYSEETTVPRTNPTGMVQETTFLRSPVHQGHDDDDVFIGSILHEYHYELGKRDHIFTFSIPWLIFFFFSEFIAKDAIFWLLHAAPWNNVNLKAGEMGRFCASG